MIGRISFLDIRDGRICTRIESFAWLSVRVRLSTLWMEKMVSRTGMCGLFIVHIRRLHSHIDGGERTSSVSLGLGDV